MALVIQKFGGTSLKDSEHFQAAAIQLIKARQAGHYVIAVTSAMAGITNQLATLAQSMTTEPNAECDTILSAGEQSAAGLLALALQKQGQKSRSWLSWQLPIETTAQHTRAKITHINTTPLKQFMAEGGISIIAGFQGLTRTGRLSTLGRGGSDTTALAIASAFKADLAFATPVQCTIFTDVEGIYTADPKTIQGARLLKQIDFSTMKRLALSGAKVLHPDAACYAAENNLEIRVRHHRKNTEGTLLTPTSITAETPLLIARQDDWTCCQLTHPHTAISKLLSPLMKIERPLAFFDGQKKLLIKTRLFLNYQSLLTDCTTLIHAEKDYSALSLFFPNKRHPKNDQIQKFAKDLTRQSPALHWQDTSWGLVIFCPRLTMGTLAQNIHNAAYI